MELWPGSLDELYAFAAASVGIGAILGVALCWVAYLMRGGE